ncbi:MAG: hypothetical protein IJC17_05270 [Clostridia bacterium]|nr:hypothetical protein [Clostridia bacterium]
MNGLQEWAIGLCAAAIACTALLLLLPSRGSAPMMKTLLSVFFCCCLLGPIGAIVTTDWGALVAPPTFSAENAEEIFYNTLRSQADTALGQLAEEALAGTGYRIEKIEGTWTESEDGRIYMNGATAWLDVEQTANAAEIGVCLNRAIDVPVRVVPKLE